MSTSPKPYIVTFQDTLRVRISVNASTPHHAEAKAIKQWSDDLWTKADAALADTSSEIIESSDRDFFEIQEDVFAHPKTNESLPK